MLDSLMLQLATGEVKRHAALINDPPVGLTSSVLCLLYGRCGQKPDQGGQRGAEGKEMDIDDDLPYPDFPSEVSQR
jgi:hypothetical protein